MPQRPFALTRLRTQIVLTLLLQVLAFLVLAGPLLATNALVNDRLADYYFFRDTLHSLHAFGEFPWWNPSYQAGFPFFFVEILFFPGRDPLFGAMAAFVWVLGRLSIPFQSYQLIYVVYIGFLVPLLLSLSVLALARQVLRHPLAQYLAITLAAFSPGVVFSLTDLGSDATAYGFLFAAAWLQFLRSPGPGAFRLFGLATLSLALSATYFSLIWTLLFVAAWIVMTICGRGGTRAMDALRHVPISRWVLLAAGVVVCALPSVLAFQHNANIEASTTPGGLQYGYERLRPGNPLEVLAVSSPGIGFEWTNYDDPAATFAPVAVSRSAGFVSYGYMGMLTLSLIVVGLVAGRRWSQPLYWMIVIASTVVMLSAFSPLFSLILAWPSPLQGVNHYSDMLLRAGLFGVLILAAGLGLEAVLGLNPRWRWALTVLFAINAGASLLWRNTLHDPELPSEFLLGLGLVLAGLYLVGLCRLALARTPSRVRGAVRGLLVLLLIDTSAMAFAHVRLSLPTSSGRPAAVTPDAIGSVVEKAEQEFLSLHGISEESWHSDHSPGAVTLVGAQSATGSPVVVSRRSYNTIEFRVEVDQPARLEWQDAFDPYWRASVNGIDVPIHQTPQGMKAVDVPTGPVTVRFDYRPRLLRASLGLAMFTWMCAAGWWIYGRRRGGKWSGRLDSNQRHLAPKASALPG